MIQLPYCRATAVRTDTINSVLIPPQSVPDYDWECPRCLVGTGEFGFEEGASTHSNSFRRKRTISKSYFGPKMPFDPVLNSKRLVTEDDVEREFWRLVESLLETVEVSMGRHPLDDARERLSHDREESLDPYSTDQWNLNILPLHPESLFRHIKSDISGMTVPWLYVGMCFSTFAGITKITTHILQTTSISALPRPGTVYRAQMRTSLKKPCDKQCQNF
jgi:hypothetical protein